MNNPYSAPDAQMTDFDLDDETYQPKLFAFNGRIGRLRYVAYGWGFSLLVAVIMGILAAVMFPALRSGYASKTASGALLILFYVPLLVALITMMRRRLHDLNRSGWWSLLCFIPLIGIFFGLYLLFAPGTSGSNDYGPAPSENSPMLWIPAILSALAMAYFCITAVTAYNLYMHKVRDLRTQQSLQPQVSPGQQ